MAHIAHTIRSIVKFEIDRIDIRYAYFKRTKKGISTEDLCILSEYFLEFKYDKDNISFHLSWILYYAKVIKYITTNESWQMRNNKINEKRIDMNLS